MDDPLACHDPDPHIDEGSRKSLKLLQLPTAHCPPSVTAADVLVCAITGIYV